MPQGNWTSRQNMPPQAAARPRLLPPVMTLSVLALLAACGQQQPTTTTHAARGGYNRPATYDPPGPPGDPWGPYIPERWIREVMRQESAGRVTATSRVGAMGLMQVMPGTYAELQARHGLGNDPYHPYDSLMAGAAYIRQMYDLYGSPAFLAAYNAGPRRLEDYLWNNRGLPDETRNYVARIGPNIVAHHPTRRAPREVYAAAEIPLSIPRGPRRMDAGTMMALREQRDATQPGIQVAQLPPGPVVRMDPIPDGSTTPWTPPVQVASTDPSAGFGGVVRMDPIPDGSTPQGAASLADAARREAAAAEPPPSLPLPALAPRPSLAASGRPMQMAGALSPPVRLAPTLSAPAGSRGLRLLGSANASPLPANLRPALATSAAPTLAVQVGAFASESLARSAASQAAGGSGGRPQVQSVAQGRNRLFRARVTGLSQSGAQTACDRLRGRGACMVLSPDAQG
jgi:hypothetical protein